MDKGEDKKSPSTENKEKPAKTSESDKQDDGKKQPEEPQMIRIERPPPGDYTVQVSE